MTPTELIDSLTEIVKSTEAAEEKIKSLEDQLESEMRRAKDLKAALDMYATAWTRELGSFYPAKRHEIDALVLGTRALHEEGEKMMRERDTAIAQGQADHRALHDALGWAHEWHGKALPAPSRAVTDMIELLNATREQSETYRQERHKLHENIQRVIRAVAPK